MRIKTIRTIQEAQDLAQVWDSLEGEKQFGTITPNALTQKSGKCKQLLDQLTALNLQTQAVRIELNTEVGGLTKDSSRVHQGVRANYGPKSSEYARVQKTRNSRASRRGSNSNTTASNVPPQS